MIEKSMDKSIQTVLKIAILSFFWYKNTKTVLKEIEALSYFELKTV